ncbi:hypothetical protein JOM56_001244 [Amanita muscaria]
MVYFSENTVTPVWQRWAFSYRALAYIITFFIIFALTSAELGYVAQQIHDHGDGYEHYATMQYKHVIGLLLFACIATLLFCVIHFWIPVDVVPAASFILAVFWGTGAGLLRTGTPYRGDCASRLANTYPTVWQPYADLCTRVIVIEALAWSLWGILIILMIGSLVHKLGVTVKSTPEEMYFAHPDKMKGEDNEA